VDQSAAYELTGTILYTGNAVQDAKAYCPELKRSVYADNGTGTYTFGLVEPGTYTVLAYACGYTPDQPSKQITITNASGGPSFTLALNNIDQDEPNDLKPNAATAAVNSGPSSLRSINANGADANDWYKFTATQGQQVSIRVYWDQPWWPGLSLSSVEDTGGNVLGYSFGTTEAAHQVDFVAPANDTYFFQISGGPGDYYYQVTVN
jgi:hypothetical protein